MRCTMWVGSTGGICEGARQLRATIVSDSLGAQQEKDAPNSAGGVGSVR